MRRLLASGGVHGRTALSSIIQERRETVSKDRCGKAARAFTHDFLYDTLGLKSTGDRPLIPLLRVLGFLDNSSKPTQSYASLKNPAQARLALAAAIRKAYEPLFAANESAHELGPDALRGLVAQVAGTDTGMTAKISGTFSTLAKLADFSQGSSEGNEHTSPPVAPAPTAAETSIARTLRPEFHYNIQVHLPTNATEETYLNIFNALRKTFQ